jgi:alcohol dehydrogenase
MAIEILRMNLQRPYVGKIFPFDNLLEALKYFQTGRSIGKVVVKV